MKLLDLRRIASAPIDGYASVRAASAALADGAGEAHLHLLRFAPGGAIGRHEAGFGQLFLVLEGHGWVEGGDGLRVAVSAGEGAFIARGEPHTKGSDSGMTALMVQVRELEPCAGASSTPGTGASGP